MCPNGFRAGLHRCVWTVPYESSFNPIEQCWSATKGYVAANNSADATVQSVQQLARDGYYGDGKEWAGITAERCKGLIEHTRHECDAWIRNSPKLRALWPSTATPTITDLTAARRVQYGAIPRAHRMTRTKKPAPVPAAPAAAAAAVGEELDQTDDDEDHNDGADIVIGDVEG